MVGLWSKSDKILQLLAYTFLITSAQFIKESYKPITSMVKKLIDDPNAVGVHASLSRDLLQIEALDNRVPIERHGL